MSRHRLKCINGREHRFPGPHSPCSACGVHQRRLIDVYPAPAGSQLFFAEENGAASPWPLRLLGLFERVEANGAVDTELAPLDEDSEAGTFDDATTLSNFVGMWIGPECPSNRFDEAAKLHAERSRLAKTGGAS